MYCVGVTAGAIGSFIGTPAEISLIRMTSDGRSVHNCYHSCALQWSQTHVCSFWWKSTQAQNTCTYNVHVCVVLCCVCVLYVLCILYDRLPVAERRGYTSVFNALFRITREEGLFTLWRVCYLSD